MDEITTRAAEGVEALRASLDTLRTGRARAAAELDDWRAGTFARRMGERSPAAEGGRTTALVNALADYESAVTVVERLYGLALLAVDDLARTDALVPR